MNRRSLAIAVSVPLLVGLWVAAAVIPVPYVTYAPGLTVDVLAESSGQERIQIDGHRSFHDAEAGELRMTTVSVTPPRKRINLFTAMGAWLDGEQSVEPYGAVYDDEETPEDNDVQSAVSMLSSQDTAVAAALRELGHELTPTVEVYSVTSGAPADGVFEVRDRILRIDGEPITEPQQVVDAVTAKEVGESLTFVVVRDGRRIRREVAPADVDGRKLIGIWPGSGYLFPFDVTININPEIGGPSAGLMFSLAIYDILTPGPLTGGRSVAGTGTIDPDGNVGAIGGIQQKIVGARESGSGLFLVPAANCRDAVGAPHGDMRVIRVATLGEAREAVEAFAADPAADLPTCEDAG